MRRTTTQLHGVQVCAIASGAVGQIVWFLFICCFVCVCVCVCVCVVFCGFLFCFCLLVCLLLF